MDLKACLIIDDPYGYFSSRGGWVVRIFSLTRNKKGRLIWIRCGTLRFHTAIEAYQGAKASGLIVLERGRKISYSTFFKEKDIAGSL